MTIKPKTCKHIINIKYSKGWVDLPPNATIPVYNKGSVYVKALRLPKGTKINFKNDVYTKSKPKKKENNPNLLFMDDDSSKKQTKPQQEPTNPQHQKTQQHPEKKEPASFVIPDGLNFSKITEDLKDTKKPPQQTNNINAAKTPVPEIKQSQTFNNDDLNSIFSNMGGGNPERPPKSQSPKAEKPKIDKARKK